MGGPPVDVSAAPEPSDPPESSLSIAPLEGARPEDDDSLDVEALPIGTGSSTVGPQATSINEKAPQTNDLSSDILESYSGTMPMSASSI